MQKEYNAHANEIIDGMQLLFYDFVLQEGDMAESVDATDLNFLSLGMETYQAIASKSREPWDILNGQSWAKSDF